MQFNGKCFFVSKNGGSIDYLDDDGQTFTLEVPKGRVSAREYVIEGFVPNINGLAVIWPPSGVGVVNPNTLEQTGANPEFSPTSAAWQQKKISIMVESATADAVARAMASMPPSQPASATSQPAPDPAAGNAQPATTEPAPSDPPPPADAKPQISA
jgi:hypothetical protein